MIEVLLSAVSPFELLAGKLLGQMGVSLVVLGIYIGLAFMMLVSFALFGLLDLSLVFYLFVFFVLTYLTIGSAMMAVGSAVNEMREAQSLMMPIILVMMVPWVLAEPIARQPNSTFSTAISFIPPVNTFAMLLRLTSSAPPPGVAGVADDRHRRRVGRRVGLVRGEDLHDRPADVRQAARPQDPGALDSRGLSGIIRPHRGTDGQQQHPAGGRFFGGGGGGGGGGGAGGGGGGGGGRPPSAPRARPGKGGGDKPPPQKTPPFHPPPPPRPGRGGPTHQKTP